MELLIAILLNLGVYYTPEQIRYQQSINDPDPRIIYAQHIIDMHHYWYKEDGTVVIEDDVDPWRGLLNQTTISGQSASEIFFKNSKD